MPSIHDFDFTPESYDRLTDTDKIKAELEFKRDIAAVKNRVVGQLISDSLILDEATLVGGWTAANTGNSIAILNAAYVTGIPIMIINREV